MTPRPGSSPDPSAPPRVGSVRIGADVGGTFTDVVLDVDGRHHSTKVLTTHDAPEVGILEGISEVAAEQDLELSSVHQVIHGTTLATNALIERNGAATAFVTTAGFRDVIETRTESRFEQYDLDIVLPAPLVERRHRFVVPERLDASGNVLLPFDDRAAAEVVSAIVEGGFESVAVGFLHSYVRADHELRFREMLASAAPHLAISISSEVSPQMREFERFNTVCANAYVQPLMASYLGRLEDRLAELGISCPVFLLHSGGGLIDVATASAYPVRLVESGPAGGAIFAAHVARRHGLDRIVSFDMGGTTAKIALIDDHVPRTASTFEVARTTRFKKGSGMPISIPVIEMIEIGAGGGSIASIDALGQIRIGPESAGADPGPAAFTNGGTAPTVTDANVELGRLHPSTFGANGIDLSPTAASAAIAAGVAEPLGLDVTSAAVGITEMVDENMANAARVHAVENGVDLAGHTVVAFGGGAPIHATRLIDKLGVDELLVPVGAGVGSAIGFLLAPFSYEAVRSFATAGDAFDVEVVSRLLGELEAEAEAFVRSGSDAEFVVERRAAMRYRGQGWEIPVAVPPGLFDAKAADALIAEFVATYERYFGRAIEGLAVEAVSWAVKVASVVDAPERAETHLPSTPIEPRALRTVHDPATGAGTPTSIVQRADLPLGATVSGPALIVEDQTTTVLGARHRAVVQGDGALRISRSDTHTVPERSGQSAQTPPTASSGGERSRGAAMSGNSAHGVHSDVLHQILWNRLIALVEEQALTLVRTSFSTSVREAGDLSAGIFDAEGRLIAQAVTGTPGHVNTMAAAVGHFIVDIGRERMFPGDVYITNDPWKGTGHLHDITVTTPVFLGDDLIGFSASTSHVVDVGGRGYGPDAREVFEEGLRIPIMKWAERGVLNDDLVGIVRANVREADQVIGDIHGLAASNETGRRRLLGMLDEFGLVGIEDLAAFIFDRTTRAVRAALEEVPHGTYRNSMDVDGYLLEPQASEVDAEPERVRLEVSLTVSEVGMHADFTGTSPVSPFGINVPIVYAQAYFTYGMMVALAPELPNNFASLAPFTVSAPDGVILNAQSPDPVSVRHVIGHFVTDLCLGALADVLPERIPAEGSGALWNFQASARSADPAGDPRPPVELLMFNSGGTGARPGLDGLTATAFPSGVRTMSVEATEQVGPIVIWRKEIREGSGGIGRHRGGLGQVIEISATEGYQFEFSAMFDRVDHPARGRHGGGPGAPGRVVLDDGTPFRTKGRQTIPVDRRLVMELPGGGGWGDPAERSPDAVSNDRAQGYLGRSAEDQG